MTKVLMVVGGVSLAIAGLVLLGPKKQKPVAELAHALEAAWADHHTVV